MDLTFKRNYHLLVLLAMLTISLILFLGDQRIVAYTIPADMPGTEQSAHIAQAEISSLLQVLGMH